MFKAIHHVAIICSDYEKSRNFYVNKLGLEVAGETHRKERDSRKLNLKVGDKYQIELFSFPNPPKRITGPEACGLRHLAFEVCDVEKTAKILTNKGIVVEDIRKDKNTGKKFTFFKDPDGLPIEIYEK